MASFSHRTILLIFFLLICFHIAFSSSSLPLSSESPSKKAKISSRKSLLASAKEDAKPSPSQKPKAKKPVLESKNQTKSLKPKKSNTTTTTTKMATAKIKLQKLNKTSAAKTKPTAEPTSKLAKATKQTTPAKSVAKSETINAAKTKNQIKKPVNSTAKTTKLPSKKTQSTGPNPKPKLKLQKPKVEQNVTFEETDGGEDLIAEFRDLPSRLQETLVPDLARLSLRSKAYLSAANAGIAEGVRPLLGSRWAPVAATAASVLLLLLPLCFLTALVRRIGPYLPLLHRALLFAQAYLAIYFATLALAAAATGLEPLRFFYAASPAAYAWTQAAQSLGYVAYLVLQMIDLVAVFSSSSSSASPAAGGGGGEAAKALGLAQMVVGLAVGLHYYAAVFHRAAAGEAPRANWRVHAVYAACFVVVCACARAERRKKAYVAGGDGAVEWKKS